VSRRVLDHHDQAYSRAVRGVEGLDFQLRRWSTKVLGELSIPSIPIERRDADGESRRRPAVTGRALIVSTAPYPSGGIGTNTVNQVANAISLPSGDRAGVVSWMLSASCVICPVRTSITNRCGAGIPLPYPV
jgi:hypothetical protein